MPKHLVATAPLTSCWIGLACLLVATGSACSNRTPTGHVDSDTGGAITGPREQTDATGVVDDSDAVPSDAQGIDATEHTDANGTIDCSRVGCAAPPVCGTQATACAPCGCCLCAEGSLLDGEHPMRCAGGCWTDDACSLLPGNSYESIELLNCGMGDEGIVSCHSPLRFSSAQRFEIQVDDMILFGTYTCEGTRISVTDDWGGQYEARLDLATNILVWGGVRYQPTASN